MTQISFTPVYLLDTCVFLWLDGINEEPSGGTRYSTDETELIWNGLADFADQGRIKIITFVRAELQQQYPPALERIRTWNGHHAPRKTRQVQLQYREVVKAYPNWIDHRASIDPADPWLVAFARHYGYTLVTEEKSAGDQKIKRRRPKLPDVCDDPAFNIPWCRLEDLIGDHRWLDG